MKIHRFLNLNILVRTVLECHDESKSGQT